MPGHAAWALHTSDPMRRTHQSPGYAEDLRATAEHGARAIAWGALALIPLFALLDTVVLPEDASRLLFWHAASFGIAALVQVLLHTAIGKRQPLLLGVTVAAAIGLDVIAMTVVVGREANPYYVGVALALLAPALLLPWSPSWAAALSALLVGGYIAAMVGTGPIADAARFATNASLLAGTAVLVVVGAFVRRQLRRREFDSPIALGAHARRQETVARLGQLALAAGELGVLMERAAALVADALGVECTGLFELGADHKTLLLRAGAGWRPGTVGEARFDAGPRTLAQHVLEVGEPVLLENLPGERRFAVPQLVRDHALVSGAMVVVNGRNRRFGVLGAFATRPWRCTPQEVDFLQAVAGVITTAIVRLESSRALAGEALAATALARVGRALISSLDTPILLERLCRLAAEALDADHGYTWLLQPSEQVYIPVSAHGLPPETWSVLRTLRIPVASVASLLKRLEREDLVQMTPAAREHPFVAGFLRQFGMTRTLFVALRNGEGIIGVQASGFTERSGSFTVQQEQLAVGIAQLASMALTNAQLVEAVEQASRLKSEFVSTMSHELRTPLNVIIGYLDMLSDQPASSEHAEILARVRSSGIELLEMIEGTLNLNRIEAGQDIPQLAEFCVDDLWGELRAEFAVHPRKTDAMLRWEPLEGVMLYTDRRKLKIIVKNLVGNALKFTPKGEVAVRCERRERTCIFTVSDTGVGIPAAHLPVIFEMFRQVDSSDSRSYSGAGLGLYIVKRLVDQLGGEVQVESVPGRGSTFRVTLPTDPVAWDETIGVGVSAPEHGATSVGHVSGPAAESVAAVHAPTVCHPAPVDTPSETAAVDGHIAGAQGNARQAAEIARAAAPQSQRKQRILYADDLEVKRHILRRFIARQLPDVEFYEACDGLQALALVEAYRPDLVLLDLRMPVMDGWTAARRIRALEGGRDLPIIALTVTASPGAEAYALHAGCNDFIPMPISDYSVLLLSIEHWLGRGRHATAHPAARDGGHRAPVVPGMIICVLCRQPLPTATSSTASEKPRQLVATPPPRA